MMKVEGLRWALVLVVSCASASHAQSWVISGQVVGTGGAPLAGVDLDLEPTGGGAELTLTNDVTAGDGTFATTIVGTPSPGSYDLKIQPNPGHLPETVTLSLSGSTSVGQITLDAGWIITGTVVDPSGVGIPGIDIDLDPDSGGAPDLYQDITDANGDFALTMPPIVGLFDVLFDPIDPGSHSVPGLLEGQFFAGNAALGTIALENGWFLSGRVVNESGVGIAGIDLQVIDALGDVIDTPGDDTDPLGFFDLLVPEGTWEVRFRQVLPGPIEYVTAVIPDLALFADVALPDVVLFEGRHLTGTVVSTVSAAIANVDVDLLDSATGESFPLTDDSTNALGVFDLLVPPGDWIVQLEPPVGALFVPTEIAVSVALGTPTTSLGTIVLADGVPVAGVTVDGSTASVPGVDLDFIVSSTGTSVFTVHDDSDLTGAFSVVVDPSTYDIAFRPPFASGLAPVLQANVSCNTPTNLGSVVLPAGRSLTGSVVASGIPVEDVEVTLADSSTGDPVYVFGNTTDSVGDYAIRIEPGTYDVTFTPPTITGLPPFVETSIAILVDTVLDVDLDLSPPPAVVALNCAASSTDAILNWALGAPNYDTIEIRRDGVLIATLLGTDTNFTDGSPGLGRWVYGVTAIRNGLASPEASCSVTITGSITFVRGDANNSSSVNLADAVAVLDILFGTAVLGCEDAADANDDGAIDIADPVYILQYLFQGGADPLPPFPDPGSDPTADSLSC